MAMFIHYVCNKKQEIRRNSKKLMKKKKMSF